MIIAIIATWLIVAAVLLAAWVDILRQPEHRPWPIHWSIVLPMAVLAVLAWPVWAVTDAAWHVRNLFRRG